jgi:hypothetical protein
MIKNIRLFAVGLMLFQEGHWPAQAQSGAVLATPGIRLEVRARSDQRTFRIGEIIPLELRFSSTIGDKYRLSTQHGDRSGRNNMDTYAVEPRSGWQDPLDLYYRTGVFIGGGIGGIAWLSAESILITADLNEWVRFDQPGDYRLTVKSRRVRDDGMRSDQLVVESNEVLLHIIAATPEWQEETLREALAVLAKSAPVRPHQPGTLDPAWDAVRTIRFLGTAAAAREMAHRVERDVPFRSAGDEECLLGLAASPAREAALDEMNKLLPSSSIAEDAHIKILMSVLATPSGPGGDKH